MKKTLYMETTEIAPEKTAGEIVVELVAGGANQINQTYDQGRITGIRWTMRVGSNPDVLFDMPVRVEPVFKILRKRITGYVDRQREQNLREKAERVAWRQLLRWVQAQMAMVDAGMVEPGEVFLAYMFDVRRSQTLFQTMLETGFKALPAPSSEQQIEAGQ